MRSPTVLAFTNDFLPLLWNWHLASAATSLSEELEQTSDRDRLENLQRLPLALSSLA
ncbi:MAG: hypothetical protein F6J92_13970 [Symploca sp. SIO1A3]|nr:hypothetical protein [Symploca sp. SIO1A3]